MYKCKVCNKEFELQRKDHYIARDNGQMGLSALAGGSEEELYDTFDCPHCGCQNVMQKRKRRYIDIEVAEEECVTASDFEEVEENEDANVGNIDVAADEDERRLRCIRSSYGKNK